MPLLFEHSITFKYKKRVASSKMYLCEHIVSQEFDRLKINALNILNSIFIPLNIMTKYESAGYPEEMLVSFSEQNEKQIWYIYYQATLDTNIETLN